MLVQPLAYSRVDGCKVPKDPYNDLHPWHYSKLAEVFGVPGKPMHGHIVKNHDELNKLLDRFNDASDPINQGPNIVQLLLKKADYPRSIDYKVKAAEKTCA